MSRDIATPHGQRPQDPGTQSARGRENPAHSATESDAAPRRGADAIPGRHAPLGRGKHPDLGGKAAQEQQEEDDPRARRQGRPHPCRQREAVGVRIAQAHSGQQRAPADLGQAARQVSGGQVE